MTLRLWKAAHHRTHGHRHACTLTHDGETVLMVTVLGSDAASRQCLDWLRQAQAGLIPPVPARARLRQLAAAPLRGPAAAQDFDCSPLPLFGDQGRQRDLF